MRPLTFDRPQLATLRTGLVLLIAFMLILTRLPLAEAVEDAAAADAAATEAPPEGDGAGDASTAAQPPPVNQIEAVPDETGAPPADATESPAAEVAPADAAADTSADGEKAAADDIVKVTTDEGDAKATAAADAAADAVIAAVPSGGDFDRMDWVAAHPRTYNHITGTGGIYGNGSNSTTVESLNAGDFRCGEQVVYFLRVENEGAATDPGTVNLTTTFEKLTTGQPGIGHERIVAVSLQEQSGGDGVALNSWTQTTAGSQVVGNVTLGDFDAGETVIVRYQVLLGCPTGSPDGGTGVIHANLAAASVNGDTISTGSQTIPFKQSGSIPRGDLTITKVVSGTPRNNPTYTVSVSCALGISDTLTFTGSGSQTVAGVPQTDTCTVNETSNGGADRTTVSVNGGAQQNSRTATIVIGAGQNNVTFTNTFLAPSISVTKSASPTTVTPGGTITYTITATNASSANTAATGVVITDNLDDDLTDVTASYKVGNGALTVCDLPIGAGNTIRCAVGTLDIGQSVVVTVTAKATVASCGQVDNRATVTGSNFSQQQSPLVTVTVACAPDLNLVKTASATSVVPGQEYTYTITATNPSTATAPATGVVIRDDLADSLTGVSAEVKVGTAAAQPCGVAAGNQVTCPAVTIPVGGSAVVTIKATPTPASCPSVANRAEATGTNFTGTEQSNPVNVAVVCTPDLTITKSATATNVVPGDSFQYRITVASPSSATATSTNVVITDNLHDGLNVSRPSFIKSTGGAAQNCDAVGAGNTIRCAVGDLAPGQSVVVTIPVQATPQSCGPLTNVATVTSGTISKGSNTVTVNVTCAPALQLNKTASSGTVNAGQPITYTVTATNPATASATATSVVITDNLDDDLTGVTATFSKAGGAAQACSPVGAGNTISCAVGDILTGQSVVVTITATTTTAACGVVTNTSFANGTNFTTVQSPTVTVSVVCPPGMSLAKTASSGTVQPGQSFTYTITATNAPNAGQPANGVVITDNLDDRLTGVSATYRVGAGPVTNCDPTGAGNTIRCAVGNLAAGTSAVVSISATAPVAGNCAAPLRNTSTAVGTNFTTVTSNEVIVTLPCTTSGPNPAIEVVKTGVAPTRGVGDTITYTYVVTNRGDQTLTNITLTDDKLGAITLLKTTLTPGESTTATATHIITTANVVAGVLTNIATVIGKTPSGGEVRDTDDETITLPGAPEIRVTKTPNLEVAKVGDTVTYTYVIRNTGTTRLTDVTLVDDKIGPIVSVEDRVVLEIGQSVTTTAEYTLTEADLARGTEVVNVAIASGLPPQGPAVQATVTARVGIEQVLNTGLLRVVKEIGGEGVPAEGAEFGFDVDCGTFSLGRAGDFTLPEQGGRHDVGVLIPEGQVCQVTESRTAGAVDTTVAVNDGAARNGTSTAVTIEVPDVPPGATPPPTVVTFVNSFDRPLVPPQDPPPPPDTPELPATGLNVLVQLLLGAAALALGAALVRRFQPTLSTGSDGARRRKG